MKALLLIVAIVVSNLAFGEFGTCVVYAVIKDSDGHTNVRAEASSESEIIHRLSENVVFEISGTETDGWIKARVTSDLFGLSNSNYYEGTITGYVHRSRVVVLEEEPEYDGSGLNIDYEIQPFDSTGRVIGRHDEGWVTDIDGRPILGVDGGLPRTQVNGIELNVDGRPIEVHEVFYRDLFSCHNEFDIRKIENTYFIFQLNSDGAGAYEMVWVVDSENGIRQRIIQPGPC